MIRRPILPAAALAAVLLVPSGVAAQAEAPPEPGFSERLGDAAREALERLREELAPLLEKLDEATDAIGELDDYGPPRVLENGDILIPRERKLPEPPPPEPEAPARPDGDAPDTITL